MRLFPVLASMLLAASQAAAAAAPAPDIFCWNIDALVSLAPTGFVALKGEKHGDVFVAAIQMPFSDVECAIDGALYTCGVDNDKFAPELKRCIGGKSKVSREEYG